MNSLRIEWQKFLAFKVFLNSIKTQSNTYRHLHTHTHSNRETVSRDVRIFL